MKKTIAKSVKLRFLYHKLLVFLGDKNIDLPKDQKVFIFGSPTYGNLGDHAIAYAQGCFLENIIKGKKIKVIEIPDIKVYQSLKSVGTSIKENDLITFVGGGNFGSLYTTAEDQRRIVMESINSNIPKIIFPQSVYYEDNKHGKMELKETKRILKKQNNLSIFAREKKSLEILNSSFPACSSSLVPDIVLSLNFFDNYPQKYRTKKIILSMRNDKEKLLNHDLLQDSMEYLEEEGYIIEERDTHIGDKEQIFGERRIKELQSIWNDFGKSKLVITDRLHGMIFAFITGTPAIVFSNNNPKIEESYGAWLSDVNYINFIASDNPEDVLFKLKEMLSVIPEKKSMEKDFLALKSAIKSIIQ